MLESFLPEDIAVDESHFNAGKLCIPYFFPKLLFRLSCLPLGRIFHIIGEQASFKSTFAAELARWHLMGKGKAFFIDTEGKTAHHIYQSLLGNAFAESFIVRSVTSLDSWMRVIVSCVEKIEQLLEKGGTIGPLALIIDSVAGTNSLQSLIEMKDKEHYCVDRFSREAKYISDFLRTISSRLSRLPMSLIFVNHKKVRIGQNFVPVKATLGGSEIRFYSSFELDLVKAKGDVYLDGTSDYRLSIMVEKNSYGASGIGISVPVVFNKEGVKFNWHAALVEWLESLSTDWVKAKKSSDLEAKIKNIFDVSVRSGGRKGKLYYCDSIGITSDKAMPSEELGLFIEQNCKEELKLLQKILAIPDFDSSETSEENLH